MKILHINLACFYYDNFEYQENMLPLFHKNMGLQVKILASTDNYSLEKNSVVDSNRKAYLNEYDIPVVRLKYKKIFGIRFHKKIFEEINEYKPDIIFVHGSQAFGAICIAKYVKKNPQVDLYVDNHADEYNSISGFLSKIVHYTIFRYFARLLSKYAKKNYGVTQGRCDFITKYYGIKKDKIELLLMGANDFYLEKIHKKNNSSLLRQTNEFNNDDFIIITGGKIDKKKNVIELIKAVLNIEIPNIKLWIFGNVDEQIKDEFNKLVDNKRIKMLGWLNAEKTYEYLIASNLAIFPGSHSVLWEQAIASGLPCVFKFWSGFSHLNINDNAIVLPNTNENDLKNAILELYNSKELFNKLKQNTAAIMQMFSYKEIALKSIKESLNNDLLSM